MSDLKSIQRADLAGKTKLTAVTIGHGRNRHQFFTMLQHDSRGVAKLPAEVLNNILTQAGIQRGATITVA